MTSFVRAIAFYLPQYHPIPENDRWWGKGFTEWTNVTRARPIVPGHYQPHIPADLGFYDLRLPEIRRAQADMARNAGIHGFCYYHYWFHGKRLLDHPINEVLRTGEPDFPFCLCWANESWNRRWESQDKEILIRQEYSEEDDQLHFRWLANAFRDPRYIRVNGRPLFLVYKGSGLPDARQTLRVWRDEAIRLGIGELFLCNVESADGEHGICERHGFDAAVEFAPDWTVVPRPLGRQLLWRLLAKLRLASDAYQKHAIRNYSALMENMLAKPAVNYPRFPGVTPAWDNSARRERGATVFLGSTPELYERWLRWAVRQSLKVSGDDPVLFINAWNEWAEGNHLEPCLKWGHAYLDATRRALASAPAASEPNAVSLAALAR